MHGNGLERKLSVQPGLYHVPSLTRHFRSWPIVLKKSVGSGDRIFSASWSDLETRTRRAVSAQGQWPGGPQWVKVARSCDVCQCPDCPRERTSDANECRSIRPNSRPLRSLFCHRTCNFANPVGSDPVARSNESSLLSADCSMSAIHPIATR